MAISTRKTQQAENGRKKKKSMKANVTSKFGSKRKLSRMGKVVKKGTMGPSTEFITRNSVLKKLQLTLKDFRRLCILKGIYPRVPKKAPKGSDKVYYDIKDISYLAHEPLLVKFREFKSFMKKIRREAGRKNFSEARRRDEYKPTFTLDHLVKERYPRFIDALRDMDDCLCMIALISSMPSVNRITAEKTTLCSDLIRQWQYYVAKTRCLKKVFVSVKGVYFQAEIMGETITWLTPHKFTQVVPREVDIRVMMTFLEFYLEFMKFTMFKLYHMNGMRYPPVVDRGLSDLGCCLLSVRTQALDAAPASAPQEGVVSSDLQPTSSTSTVSNKKSSASQLTNEKLAQSLEKAGKTEIAARVASLDQKLKEQAEEEEDDGDDDEDEVDGAQIGQALNQALSHLQSEFAMEESGGVEEDEEGSNKVFSKASSSSSVSEEDSAKDDQVRKLFSTFKFFVNREVPLDWLQLCILSLGGQVGWEGPASPFTASDPHITHQIVDRPMTGVILDPTREYIQPQWVFDSLNNACCLPTTLYGPGMTLPPHLSPFVDDRKEGYTPQYKEELSRMKSAVEVTGGGGNKSSSELVVQEGKKQSKSMKNKQVEEEEQEEDEEEDEKEYQKQVQAEKKGESYSKKRKEVEEKEEEDEEEEDSDDDEEEEEEEGEEEDDEEEDDEEEEEEEDSKPHKSQSVVSDTRKGPRAIPFKPTATKQTEEEEQSELSHTMMGKKTKRLYDRMQYGLQKKSDVVLTLEKKRQELDEEKQQQQKKKNQKVVEEKRKEKNNNKNQQQQKQQKKTGKK